MRGEQGMEWQMDAPSASSDPNARRRCCTSGGFTTHSSEIGTDFGATGAEGSGACAGRATFVGAAGGRAFNFSAARDAAMRRCGFPLLAAAAAAGAGRGCSDDDGSGGDGGVTKGFPSALNRISLG